jgi:DNA-binding IclR family transcriptional regulator
MQALVGRYGVTLHLGVWERERPICIATVEGRHPNAVAPWPLGGEPPAHCTALGKVLLASRTGKELDGLLDRDALEPRTRRTIVTSADLSRELAGVRDRGFAHEEEEYAAGACAVAAPIVHRRGAVMAAVSMSAPAHRWRARKDEYTRALVTAAASTSRRVMRRSAVRADERYTTPAHGGTAG